MCTFSEWVHEIEKNSAAAFKNQHFLPQVNILQFQQMRYDYVFRLSSPTDQHFFGIDLLHRNDSIHANVAHVEEENKLVYKGLEHFTPLTFRMISEIYAEDIALWKKLLKYGTSRDIDEHTLYDYYVTVNRKKERKRRNQ